MTIINDTRVVRLQRTAARTGHQHSADERIVEYVTKELVTAADIVSLPPGSLITLQRGPGAGQTEEGSILNATANDIGGVGGGQTTSVSFNSEDGDATANSIFQTEVDFSTTLAAPGEYAVNYKTFQVKTYTPVPSTVGQRVQVTYTWAPIREYLEWSPEDLIPDLEAFGIGPHAAGGYGGGGDAYVEAGCNIIIRTDEDGYKVVSLDIDSLTGEGLFVKHTDGECPKLYVDLDAYQIDYDDSNNHLIFADNVQDAITEIDAYMQIGDVVQIRKFGSEADDFPTNTIFSTDGNPYPVGGGRLLVWVNGIPLFNPDDYIETSTTTFELTTQVEDTDIVDYWLLPRFLGAGVFDTADLQLAYDNSTIKQILENNGQITFRQLDASGSALKLISDQSSTPTLIADQSGTGEGARIKSVGENKSSLLIQKDTASRNSTLDTLIVERTTSSILGGQAGIGSTILTRLENSGTVLFPASKIITGTESVADSAERSYFAIELSDDGVMSEKIRITPDGLLGIGTNPDTFIVEAAGDVGPSDDNMYSLGSYDRRWTDGYFGPDSLHIISKAGEAAGENTWTIRLNGSGKLEFANNQSTVVEISDELIVNGPLALEVGNSPGTTAGYGKIYVKSNNGLYYKDQNGIETSILAGTGDIIYLDGYAINYQDQIDALNMAKYDIVNSLDGYLTEATYINYQDQIDALNQAKNDIINSLDGYTGIPDGYVINYDDRIGALEVSRVDILNALDGYLTEATYINYQDQIDALNQAKSDIINSLDGYLTEDIDTNYQDQIDSLVEAKNDILQDLDGYALDTDLSALETIVDQHWLDSSQQRQDIRDVLDGYALTTSILNYDDAISALVSAKNDIINSLDGYLTEDIDTSYEDRLNAQLNAINTILNELDGYALASNLAALENTVDQNWLDSSQQRQDIRDALDGYALIEQILNYDDQISSLVQAKNDIINSLDGYDDSPAIVELENVVNQNWVDSSQQRQDIRDALDGYALSTDIPNYDDDISALNAAKNDILNSLDGYIDTYSLDGIYHNATAIQDILASLDGYLTEDIDINYQDQIDALVRAKIDIINSLDGYDDGYAIENLDNIVEQHWIDSSQQRQDIRDALDGYALSTDILNYDDAFAAQNTFNNDVLESLDGYALTTDIINYQDQIDYLNTAKNDIINSLDGYDNSSAIAALEATVDQHWLDSSQQRQDIRNVLDGYALVEQILNYDDQISALVQAKNDIVNSLDGYLTEDIDINYQDQIDALSAAKNDILEELDGYALDLDLSLLETTVDQHWLDSSQQRQDIRDSLDGYALTSDIINYQDQIDSLNTAKNDILEALDGYGSGSGADDTDLWNAQFSFNNDVLEALDGYITSSIDGINYDDRINALDTAIYDIVNSLDGYLTEDIDINYQDQIDAQLYSINTIINELDGYAHLTQPNTFTSVNTFEENIQANKGIIVGDGVTETAGAIKWNGYNIVGFDGVEWNPLDAYGDIDTSLDYVWTGTNEFQNSVEVTSAGNFTTSDVIYEGNSRYESRRRRTFGPEVQIWYQTITGIKIVTPLANNGDVVVYHFQYYSQFASALTGKIDVRRGSGSDLDKVYVEYTGGTLNFTEVLVGRDSSNNTVVFFSPAFVKNNRFRITEIYATSFGNNISNVENMLSDPQISLTSTSGIITASRYPSVATGYVKTTNVNDAANSNFGGAKVYVNKIITQLTPDPYSYVYSAKLPEKFIGTTVVQGVAEFELADKIYGVATLTVEFDFNDASKVVNTLRAYWTGDKFDPILEVSLGWDSSGYSYIQMGDSVNTFSGLRINLKEVFLVGYQCNSIAPGDFTTSYTSTPPILTTSQSAPLNFRNDNFFMDEDGNISGVGSLNMADGIVLSGGVTETAGAIEWNGANFRGYDGSQWVNLDGYVEGVGVNYDDRIEALETSRYDILNALDGYSAGSSINYDDRLYSLDLAVYDIINSLDGYLTESTGINYQDQIDALNAAKNTILNELDGYALANDIPNYDDAIYALNAATYDIINSLDGYLTEDIDINYQDQIDALNAAKNDIINSLDGYALDSDIINYQDQIDSQLSAINAVLNEIDGYAKTGENNTFTATNTFSENILASNGVVFGDGVSETAGAIEWDGTNFRGYNNSGWVLLDSAGTAGGSNTQLQWNDASGFSGTTGLTWNDNTNTLVMTSGVTFTPLGDGYASTRLGVSSVASGDYSVALGTLSSSSAQDGIAIGRLSSVSYGYGIAIGYLAIANNPNAVAIGTGTSTGSYATALGAGANASGNYSTAVGYSATATGADCVIVGSEASSGSALRAVIVGQESKMPNNDGIAIGYQAGRSANAAESIIIGSGAESAQAKGISIGFGASVSTSASATGGIAIGVGTSVDDSSVVISHSNAGGYGYVSSANSVGIGKPFITGAYGIGIGFETIVTHENSVAIGRDADSTATNRMTIGKTSTYPMDLQVTRGIAAFGVAPPTTQPSLIADVSETAGGTYTSTEQDMLNNIKTKLNAILDILEGAGLMSST